MEFEDQDDHDEEMEMAASYDSLQPHNNNNSNNSGGAASQPGRVKMPASSSGAGEVSASASASRPRYRECLKNHAVGLGGHALDGCGEFLPAGPDGTIDALKCAACHCHRNFHRKDSEPPGRLLLPPEPYSLLPSTHPHHHYGPPAAAQFSSYYRTPTGYLQVRPLALPSTSGGGGEDQEDASDVPMQAVAMMQYGSATTSSGGGGGSKKRFRTKFTAEQKEKMLGLAERLGWRIQKQDEPLVQEFCADTGVRRHVLKVWMHNNKHTLGKKP